MDTISIWTKQSSAIIHELETTGRYIAKRELITKALGEEAPFFLPAYDWLRESATKRLPPPENAGYPIWVSTFSESTMLPDPNSIILQAEIAENLLLPIDIITWTKILDCAYLPQNESDLKQHKQRLTDYNTSDIQAVTTPFFPEIKASILKSWTLLFESIGDGRVGVIWEIQKPWVKKIIR